MGSFRSLRIMDKFQFFFKRMDIDYPSMRNILEVKLTLDSRREATISMNDSKKKEGDEFKKSLISYGLTGLILLFFFYSPFDLFIRMSLILGVLMFMIITTMISDFSSVLLDIRDKNILLSKPVDERTINMAKVLHIFIYLFIITMTLSAPTLIAGTIRYRLTFSIIFFLELILMDIFIIFLTALLYTIMIRFFDGEKVKDVINNFQIVLSLSLVVGYQILFRMFNFIDFDLVYNPRWWNVLIPPAWYAAPFRLLLEQDENFYITLLSILAVVIPIIALFLHITVIGPYFERNMYKLGKVSSQRSKVKLKTVLQRTIQTIFGRTKEERIFIRFT